MSLRTLTMVRVDSRIKSRKGRGRCTVHQLTIVIHQPRILGLETLENSVGARQMDGRYRHYQINDSKGRDRSLVVTDTI